MVPMRKRVGEVKSQASIVTLHSVRFTGVKR